MKSIAIGWLNKCRCGNKSLTVNTARGNETSLWDDDAVKCNSCGRAGVIQVCEGQARVLWETNEEMAERKPMTFTKENLRERAREKVKSLEFAVEQTAFADSRAELEEELELARIALASLEAEPVVWASPKTVKQLIGQLQTFDPDLEITALLRMPPNFRDGNAIRQVPLSISHERMDGQWLAPFKSNHRKVLAFWAKPDDRNADERGDELYTAPSAPVSVPTFEEWCERTEQKPVGWVRDAMKEAYDACRAAMLQGKAEPVSQHPELTVWYGPMPETNGKANWTAMLHRKGQHPWGGITIDCSEYPDRVRYEADRMRHLIGELSDEPDILAYDADAHSGYVKPGNSPVIPDGLVLLPVKPTPEMLRAIMEANQNQRGSLATYSRLLTAAPQQEVKS